MACVYLYVGAYYRHFFFDQVYFAVAEGYQLAICIIGAAVRFYDGSFIAVISIYLYLAIFQVDGRFQQFHGFGREFPDIAAIGLLFLDHGAVEACRVCQCHARAGQ